jgi:hypothetical protein
MSRRAITIAEGVGQLFGAGDVLLREVLYRVSRSVDEGTTVRASTIWCCSSTTVSGSRLC